MTANVLIVGQLFADIFVDGVEYPPPNGRNMVTDHLICPGGVIYTATALARLGFSVSLAAPVASDSLAHYIVSALRAAHVPTDQLVENKESKTPITIILKELDGTERRLSSISSTFLDNRPNSAALTNKVSHLHVGSLGEALLNCDLIEMANEAGVTVSVDYQYNPEGGLTQDIIKLLNIVDIFFLNDHELRELTDTAVASARPPLPDKPIVVVKQGPQGATAFASDGVVHEPAIEVSVTDPTGAGDCFNAGFIYAFESGLSPAACLRYGNLCGGLSIRDYGQAAIPYLKDLSRYV